MAKKKTAKKKNAVLASKPLKNNPDCTRCGLCNSSETICCPTRGPKNAKLIMFGEALGATEDMEGRAFVGDAGRKLNYALSNAGLRRKKIPIGNVCRCRPPKNRTPSKKEQEACWPYTLHDILTRKPKAIVALGATAWRALLPHHAKHRLDKWRGFPEQFTFAYTTPKGKLHAHTCWVVGTFHPSACLRNWELDDLLVFDLKLAAAYADGRIVLQTPDTKVHVCESVTDVKTLAKHLLRRGSAVVDLESTGGTDPHKHKIRCIGFCYRKGEAHIVPLLKKGGLEFWTREEKRQVLRILTGLFLKLKIAGQGLKFDVQMLRKLLGQIDYPIVFDTMCGAHVLDENKPTNLTFLCQWYLHWQKYDAVIARFGDEGDIEGAYANAPDEIIWTYCLPGSQRVLTPNGVRKADSIRVGDQLFDGDGRQTEVVKLYERLFTGEIVKLKAAGMLPFEVTDNHPVLVGRRHRGRGRVMLHWSRADEIRKGDYLVIPRRERLKKSDAAILRLDEAIAPNRSNKMSNRTVELSPRLADLLGRFVADGCTTINGRRGCAYLSFGLHEKSAAIKYQRIVKELLGCASRLEKLPDTWRLTIGRFSIAKWLRGLCGKGAAEKRVPGIIMEAGEDCVKTFLRGYFQGDGCVLKTGKERGKWIASTVSETLAYQLQLLLASLGKPAAISMTPSSGTAIILGRKCNVKDRFTISVRALSDNSKPKMNCIYCVVSAVSKRSAENEMVYDYRTGSHTFVVGNAITHNCGYDVDGTFRLWGLFEPLIKKHRVKVPFSIELGLILPLADVEFRGLHVDKKKLIEAAEGYRDALKKTRASLVRTCVLVFKKRDVKRYCELAKVKEFNPQEFNPNSPDQVVPLMVAAGAKLTKKTAGGKISTDKLVLGYLALKKNTAGSISRRMRLMRSLTKWKSTYFDGNDEKADKNAILGLIKEDDRIHTNYFITGARTGRLSAKDPPLQTVPRVDPASALGYPVSPAVKALVKPRHIYLPDVPGEHVLLEIDYAKVELCCMSWLASDRVMIPELQPGALRDLHTNMAITAKLLRDPTDEEYKRLSKDVTKNERAVAKGVNFGIPYGRGDNAIAEANPKSFPLDMPKKKRAEQVQKVIDAWLEKYEDINCWREEQIDAIRKHGYLRDWLGRRRLLTGIRWFESPWAEDCLKTEQDRAHMEREAMNFGIQALATGLHNRATRKCYEGIKQVRIPALRIVMTLHDSLIFSVRKDCTEEATHNIRGWMELTLPKEKSKGRRYEMPLRVDATPCDYWGEKDD